MRKKSLRIASIVMVLLLLFAYSAHAAYVPEDEVNSIPKPRMMVYGSVADCSVRITVANQTIDATLELKQGNTVIASWSGTDTGSLYLYGTANVMSGVTYTLTVYGTIGGVAFIPESITKTP